MQVILMDKVVNLGVYAALAGLAGMVRRRR